MKKIDEIIKQTGIPQKEVASRMGITYQTLNYFIRQGEKNSIDNLRRIADAIGGDISDFIDIPPQTVCPHCGKEIHIKLEG